MARYLIDVNLPYRFSLWAGDEYIHIRDIDERMSDSEIWSYAGKHELVIVTKDVDFSDRALVTTPPPRVIHLRLGNLRIRDLHQFLNAKWPRIMELSADYRLVTVFTNRFEAIE